VVAFLVPVVWQRARNQLLVCDILEVEVLALVLVVIVVKSISRVRCL